MNPGQPKPPTPAELKELEKQYAAKHKIEFTKKQLLIIFNILTRMQMTYGDFREVSPIIDIIQPIVVVATNIKKDDATKLPAPAGGIITGAKK